MAGGEGSGKGGEIYEMHVRSFTRDPSSGVQGPGTYRGMVSCGEGAGHMNRGVGREGMRARGFTKEPPVVCRGLAPAAEWSVLGWEGPGKSGRGVLREGVTEGEGVHTRGFARHPFVDWRGAEDVMQSRCMQGVSQRSARPHTFHQPHTSPLQ